MKILFYVVSFSCYTFIGIRQRNVVWQWNKVKKKKSLIWNDREVYINTCERTLFSQANEIMSTLKEFKPFSWVSVNL